MDVGIKMNKDKLIMEHSLAVKSNNALAFACALFLYSIMPIALNPIRKLDSASHYYKLK